MSVKIRLRRTGAKRQPSYRFVVADSRSPRDGRFLEIVGHYNPRRTPVELVVDEDKVKRWLGQGAQPSDTVARLLAQKGLYDQSLLRMRKPRAAKKGKS
ncbi:MAG: 30S ribosomal protein S16 [Candidatus Eremiobacter antarcticus]|nr:30S ribosomal protein S16 [Candidatus Eremiobacteraeota bacterium]MBC5808968.1 30S ribosomal protein S16 [Candidatus Eremiobacteraeota bacterium]PZR60355.1 MAG: 30S ribosomal protein S16 [Candidatus Eremiobacter sp. RRmetagenome_bin22]